MLSVQHAIYLETRSEAAHAAGRRDEAIQLAKKRDAILSRLQPSETDAYSAWACESIIVEDLARDSARVASRRAS